MKYFVLFIVIVSVFGKNEIYKGWKSYYVTPQSKSQLIALAKLKSDVFIDVDILSQPYIGREGVYLIKPSHQDSFRQFLKSNNIQYRYHSADVKRALDSDEHTRRKRQIDVRDQNQVFPYNSYQELDFIYEYLDDIAAKYPNTVELVEPTVSFEGRKIKYLKISTTKFNDTSKPIIFIDGGIHAREWITPPVVTWAIHKLVENITEPDLLEKFDWILFPVVNPDGYEFTFTTNRFWRKTRSTNQHLHKNDCTGVDANRNFDFFWNTVGTSSSPCDETYAGRKAFSEVETRVVRDILHDNLNRLTLYLSLHSYGSMILYPWGHDGSTSEYIKVLRPVANAMAKAIEANKLPHFPKYMVGNSALILFYGAAGASDDYAHMIGVPLSYNIELPGLADGLNGFHLDPKYIQQVCTETWAGIVAGARTTSDLYNLTQIYKQRYNHL